MKKFDIVYEVHEHFATVASARYYEGKYFPEIRIGIVVERMLESCGKKQATFFDRGGVDSVFGRVHYFNHGDLFASAEEAVEALRKTNFCDVICNKIYSDSNKESFEDLRNGNLIIAEK